jgi:serine/threonine-protein kinase
MLGRYALHEKIAAGGMATVHIARLLGPVGFMRTVAIKRMHRQLVDDPLFVSMFLDEARLAARISHPNVVTTLDVVQSDGELVLVMEYVRGESLARLIKATRHRGERISPSMATTIMVGVLHGLHAAHEATDDQHEPLGLVHRDVSPHNILVGTDGVARVLDFGIAKAAGRVQTTGDGQLKGKLGYVAPEQVNGTATRVTDVYAASVTFWEALTGERLFKGDNQAQVLERVLQGCSVKPSSWAPDVPAIVDDVIMRGLSVNPADRWPTARDMARALEDATLPMMAASKVGDWVAEVASEMLAERSAIIARIESDSSVSRLRPTRSQLASTSRSLPKEPVAPQRRGRTLGTALVGTALAIVFGAWLVLQRAGAPADGVHPASAAPSAAGEPSTPPSSTSVSGATSAVTAASVSESTSPAQSAMAPAKPLSAHRAAAPAPAATTRPPPACNPPWYVDSRGARVFKQECL